MKTFNELLEEFQKIHTSMGMVEDVKILYDYTTKMKFEKILELGVLHGNSTRTFACAASTLPDCHVTSIDVEQGCIDEVSRVLKDDGLDKYVAFYKSDSVKFLENQPNNCWDCIFIDTDHRLTQTIAEIFLAGLKIKQQDGFIFMHDTHMSEIQRAIGIFEQYKKGIYVQKFNTPAGLDMIVINRSVI